MEAHKVPHDPSTCSRQQTQPLPSKGHRCNSRKITQCKAKFGAEQLINDTLWKAVLAAASTRHPLPPAEPSDRFQCHKNKERSRGAARPRPARSGGIFQSQLSHIFCFLSQTWTSLRTVSMNSLKFQPLLMKAFTKKVLLEMSDKGKVIFFFPLPSPLYNY